MSNAEGKIGSGKPGDAQSKQNEATAALQQAREQLEAERQKMLAEIESQVKKQVLENLALMLEKQRAIRETNESLKSRLADGSREALVRLKALAASETHIANLAESTAQLVEDTEFSFALPPALRNIQRRAILVTSDLTTTPWNPETRLLRVGLLLSHQPHPLHSGIVGLGNHLRHILKIQLIITLHVRNLVRAPGKNMLQPRLQIVPSHHFLINL